MINAIIGTNHAICGTINAIMGTINAIKSLYRRVGAQSSDAIPFVYPSYTLNMLRQHIHRKAKQTHNQSAVLCHLHKRMRKLFATTNKGYPFVKAIATVALLNNNNAICIARHLCGIILFMRSHLAYDTLTSRLLFRHSRGRRSLAN